MALKDIVLATKAEEAGGKAAGILVPRLEAWLETQAADQDRRDGKFHPSDLSNLAFCPRSWAAYNYHPKGLSVKTQQVGARLRRIFDNGTGMHARVQGYLSDIPNLLWGTWIHPRTGAVRRECFRPAKDWVYAEVRLEHPEDNMLGSSDGFLSLNDGKWGLELKSINSQGFRFLGAGVKPQHAVQVDSYFHMAEWGLQYATTEFGRRPLDGFLVVYESKDTQELVELPIKNDPARVAATIDSKRPLMEEALMWPRYKKWPPCRCPDGKTSPLCKLIG